MRTIIYYLLTLLELPFMILAYIDYFLNLICKSLSNGCIIFIIPSILFVPITLLHNFGCTTIVYIKNRTIRNYITFKEAQIMYMSRFPEL